MKVYFIVLLASTVHGLAPTTLNTKAPITAKISQPVLGASPSSSLGRARHHHLIASAPIHAEAPPGGAPLTLTLIAIWYAASVVCNQSSKVLMVSLGAQSLTLTQLIISAACGGLVLAGMRMMCSECAFPSVAIQSREQALDTTLLAAILTAGLVTLNACFGQMHVSLVMVLRAAEPLTTLAIGTLGFGTRVPLSKAATLLPIVAGCALSAVGSFQATSAGLALALLSNVFFSLRGLLGKRLAKRYGGGAVESFFHLCAIGAVLQATSLVIVGGGLGALEPLRGALLGPGSADMARLAMLNGASFYAYLQLSWVCLGRMSAVSHSVANSLRRPVTVIAALAYAPVPLTLTNIAGIGLACASAAAYGLM